jgi:FtsZ-interacting cell division protein ZipA
MSQNSGFIYLGLLADADNLFELLGPLLIFGIYAIAAIAKKWASSKQTDSEEKPTSELQRAVREKYKEIHARQTGKTPVAPKFQPQRKPESTRPVPTQQRFERPAPVRQVAKKPVVYPVQVQKQPRYVRQQTRPQRHRRPKPVETKAQTPQPVHRPKPKKQPAAKPLKQKYTENILTTMIRRPESLRSAIILKEILDKPIALRDTY